MGRDVEQVRQSPLELFIRRRRFGVRFGHIRSQIAIQRAKGRGFQRGPINVVRQAAKGGRSFNLLCLSRLTIKSLGAAGGLSDPRSQLHRL